MFPSQAVPVVLVIRGGMERSYGMTSHLAYVPHLRQASPMAEIVDYLCMAGIRTFFPLLVGRTWGDTRYAYVTC